MSTAQGKPASDKASQAPFSYDIRVTGDISPYANADDGRTTRVSVKITSNDDLVNILQARKAGGAHRPHSLANPRELLNVDINARVNPLTEDRDPSPKRHTSEKGSVPSSPMNVPVSNGYRAYTATPVSSTVNSGGSTQSTPLAIAATAANEDANDRAIHRLWSRSPPNQSRSELSEVMERTAGQIFPNESQAFSPLRSEMELDEVMRRTAGMPESAFRSGTASSLYEEYRSPPSRPARPPSKTFSSHQPPPSSRMGGSIYQHLSPRAASPLRSSNRIQVIEEDPHHYPAPLLLSRSLSPPPTLGRRSGSLAPPSPAFALKPRSATPPPVMEQAWYMQSRAGGEHEEISRPGSVQSQVSLASSSTTTTTTTTHLTTTTTTTHDAAVMMPLHTHPSTPMTTPARGSAPMSTGPAPDRRGGCNTRGDSSFLSASTSNFSSDSSSFVGYQDFNRVHMAHMQRSPKNCFEVCYLCNKRISSGDRVLPHDRPIHRGCLRCADCRKLLSVDNYSSVEDVFYCQTHYDLHNPIVTTTLSSRIGGGHKSTTRPSHLTLSFNPHTIAYSDSNAGHPSFDSSTSSLDLNASVACSCTCACIYCPISLYGINGSDNGDYPQSCHCACHCPVCVRARGIHSSLGTPPPWTPCADKSIIIHPPSARSTPFPGAQRSGGSMCQSFARSETPYHALDRSINPEAACHCACQCSFCPNALYGLVSTSEEFVSHPCHCDCSCSICMRALNIYDNFGAPPPRTKTPAGCLNPGENTPCLLFARTGGSTDASVFECPCPNCHDQRTKDATLIERIMAYYYSRAMYDSSFYLSPNDKEYIRLICPCCHCRRFRESSFKPTGSPALKPQDNVAPPKASPTPSKPAPTPAPPSPTPPSKSADKSFAPCPCPNCQTSVGPVPAAGNGKPPSQPGSKNGNTSKSGTPPPASKAPSAAKPADFGACPCPNCTSGTPKVAPAAKPASPPPPPSASSKASSPPKDFGACPCPNCTSGSPVAALAVKPASPTPPAASPKASSPSKDFGACPCPNCTSGTPKVAPAAKPASSPPPPPASPKASPSPNDFGACPCPNCTSGAPAAASTAKPASPTPPPASPKSSSPPKDFGACPCPNCTSGTPIVAPAAKPVSPPPASKAPSGPKKTPPPSASPPPKDFGTCPCPNCTSSGSAKPATPAPSPPAATPASPKPSKAPSPPPSKVPPADFGVCPCPNCQTNPPPASKPSLASPPAKPAASSSPPPAAKAPSNPPKDFGKCPCPNCDSTFTGKVP
ncbi:hypothetical protein BJ085DRAFT_41084, partial [Dimargaris cristalligena]